MDKLKSITGNILVIIGLMIFSGVIFFIIGFIWNVESYRRNYIHKRELVKAGYMELYIGEIGSPAYRFKYKKDVCGK